MKRSMCTFITAVFVRTYWQPTPEHKQTQIKLHYQNVLFWKKQPPLKTWELLDSVILNDTKQENKVISICLCSMFNREHLRSVEQGLVLHGVLVHSQQVALRRTDAACYHSLVSWSEYFLHHQWTSSTITQELQVWLNKVTTTDPAGVWPVLLHIAPIQLCVWDWPPTLQLLFRVRRYDYSLWSVEGNGTNCGIKNTWDWLSSLTIWVILKARGENDEQPFVVGDRGPFGAWKNYYGITRNSNTHFSSHTPVKISVPL